MVYKKTIGSVLFDMVNAIVLILLMIVTLYPFLYVVFSSVSDAKELVAHSGLLIKPVGFSWAAYEAVIKNDMIWLGYRNTLFYVIVGTAFNIIMTSMGAYVLSRKDFLWKNVLTTMVVITMFFGGGLIPTYLLMQKLGFVNSVWALIIPGAISTWNLIIMRTSFSSIPASLEESAKMDGANDFTILFKIIIPLSLPVIAVMVLYYGVAHWNSWFSAMIYLRKRELYPLQLILREILVDSRTEGMMTDVSILEKQYMSETIKHATIVVSTLPILCSYPYLQKYFVKGVMIGALKG